MTYALYPQVAVKFLRGEIKEESLPAAAATAAAGGVGLEYPAEFSVDVDGDVYNVKVTSVMGGKMVTGKPQKAKAAPPGAIVAPMQGMILSLKVQVGDKVKEDDVVATIEAMKMQNDVKATHDGTVKEIHTHEGEVVNNGDVLMVVS